VAVLQRAREIRVAGPDAGDGSGSLVTAIRGGLEGDRLFVGERGDLHDRRPVRRVLVWDEQEDRRAKGEAVPNPGDDLGPIVLDRLSRAAAVATLAAGEIGEEMLLGEREAGRHALDRDAQHRAV